VEHLLEYEPNHVRLMVRKRRRSSVTLDIDLTSGCLSRDLTRCMLRRGNHDPVMHVKLNQFMSLSVQRPTGDRV